MEFDLRSASQSAIPGYALPGPRATFSPALRIGSLQWAVGGFSATIGALMLVVPYQFSSPAYGSLRSQLGWWGPGLVLGGASLIAVATLAPRFRFIVLAHLWAGSMLIALAIGFAVSGSWTGTTNYLVLGLGIVFAPLIARTRRAWLHGEVLSVLLSFGALLSGVLMLALPAQFSVATYDGVRPYLAWYGVAFAGSGLLACLSHTRALLPSGAARWVSLLVALVFFSFGAAVAFPNHIWTGIAYYWGLGGGLVVLAGLGSRLQRIDPGSLRTRLALILAAAVAAPLLVVVPLYANEEENQAVSEVLQRQQVLAGALAQDASDYIALHLAGVKLLAGQPGLLALSPTQHSAVLENGAAAYPDMAGFATVAADGQSIARTDTRTATSWIGDSVFETARRTHQPTMAVDISPVSHRPMFSFGVPILDTDDRFVGMVSASLESSRLADFLNRTDFGADARVYLVNASGRVIVHPDLDLVASFADLSATRPVRRFLTDLSPSGSLRIAAPGGGVMASYARVSDLGLGVIVERPAAAALAVAHGKLDFLFAGLVLAVVVAAGFGVLAAGWLSRPLATLSAAVEGLAAGDDTSPLPSVNLTEVAGLAIAFGTMRARIVAHTTELLAASRELEAVYRVGQTVTSALELDVVLNTIARCTAELLGSDTAAILLVDQATQTLSVKGAYGLSEGLVRRTRDRLGESIAGRVAQTGQPIIANDLPNHPLFFNPAAEHEGLLATASVPLVVGQEIIGTLDVHSRTDPGAFGPQHIRVLQMLASQAAIAIENARLYQGLRLARDELELRVEGRTAELRAANAQIQTLNDDLEQRVVERTAELQAANGELEAFSYSVSHDLRAPLRAINGFSRILLEEHASQLVPEAVAHLELVRDNARQMGRLIDDLLSFSRLSRQGLRKDRVLPAELVREVLDDLALDRQGRQVEIVVGELPACRADMALLKQLFVNLLSNALKFTQQRALGHIEVGSSQIDGETVYFVKDNGAGFNMKYAHKLFGVFQRLHRAEDFEGTGVGLAIVQRIVHRHGGRVWAVGAPDQGATFSFTLGSAQRDAHESADERQLDGPSQRAERTSDEHARIATRDAA